MVQGGHGVGVKPGPPIVTVTVVQITVLSNSIPRASSHDINSIGPVASIDMDSMYFLVSLPWKQGVFYFPTLPTVRVIPTSGPKSPVPRTTSLSVIAFFFQGLELQRSGISLVLITSSRPIAYKQGDVDKTSHRTTIGNERDKKMYIVFIPNCSNLVLPSSFFLCLFFEDPFPPTSSGTGTVHFLSSVISRKPLNELIRQGL